MRFFLRMEIPPLGSGHFSGRNRQSLEPILSKAELLRNEAQLHFVSLRPCSIMGVRGELSRVKMNALRAPLTALPAPKGMCLSFLA